MGVLYRCCPSSSPEEEVEELRRRWQKFPFISPSWHFTT
jgi:hypothetical protein